MDKKKGSPKEKRTALINNAGKENSPQTSGMSKRGKLRYWKASANRKSRG